MRQKKFDSAADDDNYENKSYILQFVNAHRIFF